MRKMMLAVALIFAIGTTAQAQTWMYGHGPGGTPPLIYQTGPFGSYQQPAQPQYVPSPPHQPSEFGIPDLNRLSRSRCPYGVQC